MKACTIENQGQLEFEKRKTIHLSSSRPLIIKKKKKEEEVRVDICLIRKGVALARVEHLLDPLKVLVEDIHL